MCLIDGILLQISREIQHIVFISCNKHILLIVFKVYKTGSHSVTQAGHEFLDSNDLPASPSQVQDQSHIPPCLVQFSQFIATEMQIQNSETLAGILVLLLKEQHAGHGDACLQSQHSGDRAGWILAILRVPWCTQQVPGQPELHNKSCLKQTIKQTNKFGTYCKYCSGIFHFFLNLNITFILILLNGSNEMIFLMEILSYLRHSYLHFVLMFICNVLLSLLLAMLETEYQR